MTAPGRAEPHAGADSERIGADDRIERCVVFGGTHGNELTGAFLARHWLAHPREVTRPSFATEVVLGNPAAFARRVRYVDRDLNRCFARSALRAPAVDRETARAREIADLVDAVPPSRQVLLDLHTTMTWMGTTVILMVPSAYNLGLVATLQAADPGVRCYYWHAPGREPVHLNGLSPHGVALELGPVPHGILRADVLATMRATVGSILDYTDRWNEGHRPTGAAVTVHRSVSTIDFPRGQDGLPTAVVHPERQDRDYVPLRPGDPLFLGFDGEVTRYHGPPGLCPVFINEAEYYEQGIAMALTEPMELSVP